MANLVGLTADPYLTDDIVEVMDTGVPWDWWHDYPIGLRVKIHARHVPGSRFGSCHPDHDLLDVRPANGRSVKGREEPEPVYNQTLCPNSVRLVSRPYQGG